MVLKIAAQGYARQVLHDEVQVVVRFNDSVQLHDVGVIDAFQDLYLPSD